MTNRNRLKLTVVTAFLCITILFNSKTNAHCEVPCGIYGDSVRVTLILEHIDTIEKAMNQINLLSKEEKPNYNQIVRWVVNKEEHAEKIQEIVSQYFLHQRVKLTDPENEKAYLKYVKLLESLHKISVYSMKVKQTTDVLYISKLHASLNEFEKVYFEEHKH